MIKEDLKPIDVSKYKVTETGQVLKMPEDKKNILRLAKDGEGTCLDCEWGTCLLGGSNAVCLHTGKKNKNELTRCEKWIKRN